MLMAVTRILERTSGRITLSGTDIALVGLHTLRQAISVVPQVRNNYKISIIPSLTLYYLLSVLAPIHSQCDITSQLGLVW